MTAWPRLDDRRPFVAPQGSQPEAPRGAGHWIGTTGRSYSLPGLTVSLVLHALVAWAVLMAGTRALAPAMDESPVEIVFDAAPEPAPPTAIPVPSASTPPDGPSMAPDEPPPEASAPDAPPPPPAPSPDEPQPEAAAPPPPAAASVPSEPVPPPVAVVPDEPAPPPVAAIPAEPAPPPAAEPPPPPPTAAVPPAPPRPSPVARPVAPAPRRPAPPPRRTERPAVPQAHPAPEAGGAAAALPPAATAPPPAAPVAPSAGIDAGWRGAVSNWLRAHRRYPEQARARGQEGVVGVAFTAAQDGRVVDVRITSSSGFPLLDQAVLDMLAHERLPAFPPGMPQAQVSLSVAVRFTLEP